MYAYKRVSREEQVWRGLAIAMIFAMVGMAVMPAMNIGDVSAYLVIKYKEGEVEVIYC